jgi:hypothetical protein
VEQACVDIPELPRHTTRMAIVGPGRQGFFRVSRKL